VTVDADDPRSVAARNRSSVLLTYDTERVEINASNRISRDLCSLTTEVTVDGETIFEERWIR